MNKGQIIVFSGPSGVGKGTVLRSYMESRENIRYSVSATTRAPRPGETEGKSYYFLTRDRFQELIQNGGMLEYAVYNGNYYGTPKEPVIAATEQGQDIVLEIEVQGAMRVKELCPEAVMIFVMPPSWESLRQRLVDRNTEDEATIANRMAIAREEVKYAYQYDYVIINDVAEEAACRLRDIVSASRNRQINMKEFIDEVNQNA